MHSPDISYIIPALNAEKFLEQVLNSILKQNFDFKCEIILIDNGSTDQTLEIARKYHAIVANSKAATIAQVKNEGARLASAEILCFLDSDLLLPESFTKNATEALQEKKNSAFGYAVNMPTSDNFIGRCINLINLPYLNKPYSNWLLRAIVLRKNDFVNLNGFDSELITCEDVDLGYRLSKIGKLKCDTSAIAKHLDDPENLIELFKKEYWRGQDTLILFFKYFFKRNELLYLAMQLWFWVAITLAAIGVIINHQFIFMSILLLITPAVILTYRQRPIGLKFKEYFLLFVYNLIYFNARSLVLGKGIIRVFNYFRR